MRKKIVRPVPFLCLIGFCMAVSAAHAQLVWEKTHIEKQLELGQQKAEAVFEFENKGRYPVTIRSTSTSCGCTAAVPTKNTFYPGEKGQITATFTIGNRVGAQRNMVQVFTDDPRMPQHTLVFAAEIPRLIDVKPRMIHWRTGAEEDLTREVTIELNPEAGVQLLGVKPDNDLIEAVLEEAEPNRFLVKLTPRSTKSPGRAIISLQTEPVLENNRHFSFYAYIR